MIFRKHIKELEQWKASPNRKPLIIRGARQVGKTTLINHFGAQYPHFISLNLERKEHKQLFIDFDSATDILDAILLSKGIATQDYNTILLFIDEIQESTAAIRMLRYFYEDLPNLHVVAAGSLLEFSLKEVQGFPVGRVEYLYLQPLNFEEFLIALDNPVALKHYKGDSISKIAHPTLMSLFHEYVVVGGMPEIVANYINHRSVAPLVPLYEAIWTGYSDDVAKYAANGSLRNVIKHVMTTAPTFVDERVTFQHFGNSNYKSREVGEAFRSLDAARVIYLLYPSTETEPPARTDFKKSPRMQFLDTGLLNHALGIQQQMLAMKDLNSAFKGRIIPHVATQELISLQSRSFSKPNFWVREKKQSSAEVDLLLTVENNLIPVEIKSGPKGKLRSLQQFIDSCPHNVGIRIYAGNMSLEDHKTTSGKPFKLLNLPYFLAGRLPEFAKRLVNDTI